MTEINKIDPTSKEYLQAVAAGLDYVLSGQAFILLVYPVSEGTGKCISNLSREVIRDALSYYLETTKGNQNEGG